VIAAQRVQLHRDTPDLAATRELGRLVTLVGRDDERAALAPREFQIDFQRVVSGRQIRRQRQVAQHVPAPVVTVRSTLGQAPRIRLAGTRSTILEGHVPLQQRILFDRRRVHARGARTGAQHDDVA
jgi:hypothetical protein